MACQSGGIRLSVGVPGLDLSPQETYAEVFVKLDGSERRPINAQIESTNRISFYASYTTQQLSNGSSYAIQFSVEGETNVIVIPLRETMVANYLRQCILEDKPRVEEENRKDYQMLSAGDEAWNRLMSCSTRNLVTLCQGTIGRTALHFYGNALLQNNVPSEKIAEVRNRVRTICGLMQSSGVNTSDLDGGEACQSR